MQALVAKSCSFAGRACVIVDAAIAPRPVGHGQSVGGRIAQRVGIGRRHLIGDARQVDAIGIGIGQRRHRGGLRPGVATRIPGSPDQRLPSSPEHCRG